MIIERTRLSSASSRLSDKVLDLQHAVDKLIRRLRRGGRPAVTQPRLLIVQIDGLSRSVIEQAMAAGYLPFIKRLLRRHGFRMQAMSVGLPTSTPAFQMAVMYGVRPDIPLQDIFRNVWPFVLTDFACVALFTLFPGIVTFLPNLTMGGT